MSGSSEPNLNAAPSSTADRAADVFPVRGRLLGLDFGTKRVGIAVCDDEQRIASPLEIYTRSRPELDAGHLQHVAREYRVVGLVVGLPLHMGGEEGQKAREARRFGAWAASATTLPLTFWDERLTSAAAEEYLISARLSRKKRKTRIDKVAAQIMLQ
jgi:putative Holliday junction resolvase